MYSVLSPGSEIQEPDGREAAVQMRFLGLRMFLGTGLLSHRQEDEGLSSSTF